MPNFPARATHAAPILMAAFDHAAEFHEAASGGLSEPGQSVAQTTRAKELVFEGIRQAVDAGVPREHAAVLLDDKYAQGLMSRAREAGIAFSIPVDSPTGHVVLQPGWQDILLRNQPDWAKPLLFLNVEGDAIDNHRQLESTLVLQRWLQEHGGQLLVEILIPPEPAQLDRVGGDLSRYRLELIPDLVVAAMESVQQAGIRPNLWKVEAAASVDGARKIGQAAVASGVDCLILGSGESLETVGDWLAVGKTIPGYRGFAVGRTIWQEPVETWAHDKDDEQLRSEVARRYTYLATAFTRETEDMSAHVQEPA
ncbi:DUF2090 domain-containing protein [Microbacterium sp. X-17]|uniref:2-deoxy-5-keto-D-gluconate 6-phosphate aldolase domain-containing protein n=1 Tax=Microbacterium sp. X-17 TaxID=3144404 RepID=UPI0031F50250